MILQLAHNLLNKTTDVLYGLSLKSYSIEKSIAIRRVKRAEKYNAIMANTINENNQVVNVLKSKYNLN